MTIKLIACLDINDGIGDESNNLLFDIKEDKTFFKNITSGKPVVMGRITWESLPEEHRPLKKRKNYVLTQNEEYKIDDERVTVITNIDDILELSKTKDVFIIGGQMIYEEFMKYADEMYLTHVHKVNPFATTFFPDYDTKEWSVLSVNKHDETEDRPYTFSFAHYKRK